jgi:hypothetical protein
MEYLGMKTYYNSQLGDFGLSEVQLARETTMLTADVRVLLYLSDSVLPVG